MTRAVITGLGAITPIGNTVSEYWQNLVQGVSGTGLITSFDASHLGSRVCAEVKNFDPLEYMDSRTARRSARFSHFAIACAHQALKDAGLSIDDGNRDSIAVVM
ncbi:MAG TPA: beta-ketoacyl synthase N-terminal-like domain-containing protein, partial [Dehalococcoidia bacterium]|nr:beta-ketoacyl synthase N-terminal-like domain-containing protein [Dehalococcoidia bacterium]